MSNKSKNKIDLIDPRQCINTRIRMITRSINKVYSGYYREAGISVGQQSILLYVGKKKEVSQSQIGKDLILERSTVTRELDGLIKKGYLKKYPGTGSPLVKVTQTGNRFLNVLIPKWQKAQEEAGKILGAQGEKALDKLTQRMNF